MSTIEEKNSNVGLDATYSGSSATSLRTAIWLAAMSYDCDPSLSSASAMNSNALSGTFVLAPTARVHPPDMLTAPGAWPSCVGMGAWPMTSLHSGHGFVPVSSQVPLSHEPSRSMASLPWGIHWPATMVPMLVSSASSGFGPMPPW